MKRDKEDKPNLDWTDWASAGVLVAFLLLMGLTMSEAFRKDEPPPGRSPLSHIPESIAHLEPLAYATAFRVLFGHME